MKRAVFIVAIALLLSVLSAWLPAATTDAMKQPRTRVSSGDLPSPAYLTEVLPPTLGGTVRTGAAWGSDRTEWYAWLATPSAPKTPGMMMYFRYRFGWPWRCLEYDAIAQNGSDSERTKELHLAFWDKAGPHAGIKIPSWLQLSVTQPGRVAPLIPIARGFLLNTFFYCVVAWLALSASTTLRRHLRRRRNLCTSCGYNLAGITASLCPECGQSPTSLNKRVLFARFTDRSRNVMALANHEAKKRSQDNIAPEHILLGLLLEGGVSIAVLSNLNVDPQDLLHRVKAQLKAAPARITMGKLPHAPAARQVIEHALEESKSLGHNYVGTEHLLLGLLRDPAGVLTQLLADVGVDFPKARAEVARLLGASCQCGYPVGDFAVCPECGKPVVPVPEKPA